MVPVWTPWALLVGRVLIAFLFLAGAVQKGVDQGPVLALLADRGWPGAWVWPALVFDAVAGMALVLGVWVRPVALLLGVYCAVTSLFHLIPADPWQMSIFIKNWAIAGGCLCLAAAGSGRLAVRAD